MSANYRIYPAEGLKFVQIWGETNFEELRDLALRYKADPEYSMGLRQLVDMRELVEAQARFTDVFALRNFYLRTFETPPQPTPVAIVAPSDMAWGICNMFLSLMVGQKLMKLKVFNGMTSAMEWLGPPWPDKLDDMVTA